MSNFEKLYCRRKALVEEEMRKQGIKDDIADDLTLQCLAPIIATICYRNGLIEDLHSKIPELTDEVMKELNKDICNRVYTFLKLCFSDDIESETQLTLLAHFGDSCSSSWDNPVVEKDMLVDEKILRKILG